MCIYRPPQPIVIGSFAHGYACCSIKRNKSGNIGMTCVAQHLPGASPEEMGRHGIPRFQAGTLQTPATRLRLSQAAHPLVRPVPRRTSLTRPSSTIQPASEARCYQAPSKTRGISSATVVRQAGTVPTSRNEESSKTPAIVIRNSFCTTIEHKQSLFIGNGCNCFKTSSEQSAQLLLVNFSHSHLIFPSGIESSG